LLILIEEFVISSDDSILPNVSLVRFIVEQ